MAETTQPPVLIARDAAAAAPLAPGRLSALLLAHGSMQLRWYAPQGADPQTPHDQDELYVVAAGTGWFRRGEERVRFGPHDVLFVRAGEAHCFEEFSPDFATWVVFWGPPGGEAP
jgi:mannose-6-phosphate isomerase-like protein (cupin superfamily)